MASENSNPVTRNKRGAFGLVRAAGVAAIVLGVSVASVSVAAASASKAGPTTMTLTGVAMAVPTTTTSGTSFPLMQGGHIQATIDLTSTTTFKEMGVTAPTSANVMPGEQVIAGGSWVAATKTLTVKTLRIIPVQSRSYPCPVKIAPITDSYGNVSFTVTCGKRIYTVDVTSTTKYSENHVKNPSVSNVKVGEHVVVVGRAYGYPISTIISASAVHIVKS